MIKYNTRDLIRRATQLADLENSDFISWNENIMAINEAYQYVYQKAINRDEKYYLKECVINAPVPMGNRMCYKLPNDFYQLYSVSNVANNSCIIRKSVNDSFSLLGYSISNGQLIITGSVSGSLLLRYYPTPKGLTYRGNDVKIGGFPTEITKDHINCDIYNQKIVDISGVSTNKTVTIYHLDTGETVSKEIVTTPTLEDTVIIATKDGFILGSITPEGKANYDYYTDNFTKIDPVTPYRVGEDPNTIHTSALFLSADKNALFFDKEKRAFLTPDGLIYVTVDERGLELLANVEKSDHFLTGSIDKENGVCFFTEISRADITRSRNMYRYKFGEDSYVKIINKFDDIKYILTNGGINLYCTNSGLINDCYYTYSHGSDMIGINKIDSVTGYGVTRVDGTVKSIYQDTELDYPNNLFISFLAYKLAMMYKSKQGGDTNSLIMQFETAESQFYDSITQDVYGTARIQNVY